ncbi:MAG: hypothetical protein H6718_04245 [Polyangiaceae bacterium]|nr:hypothetical protein [Polyangiaceae bacterium]
MKKRTTKKTNTKKTKQLRECDLAGPDGFPSLDLFGTLDERLKANSGGVSMADLIAAMGGDGDGPLKDAPTERAMRRTIKRLNLTTLIASEDKWVWDGYGVTVPLTNGKHALRIVYDEDFRFVHVVRPDRPKAEALWSSCPVMARDPYFQKVVFRALAESTDAEIQDLAARIDVLRRAAA